MAHRAPDELSWVTTPAPPERGAHPTVTALRAPRSLPVLHLLACLPKLAEDGARVSIVIQTQDTNVAYSLTGAQAKKVTK